MAKTIVLTATIATHVIQIQTVVDAIIVIIATHVKMMIKKIIYMKIDLTKFITYDFSNLKLQENSTNNCFGCDSCDSDCDCSESNSDSDCNCNCDSCNSSW